MSTGASIGFFGVEICELQRRQDSQNQKFRTGRHKQRTKKMTDPKPPQLGCERCKEELKGDCISCVERKLYCQRCAEFLRREDDHNKGRLDCSKLLLRLWLVFSILVIAFLFHLLRQITGPLFR
jgi:hypothetical protein